MDFTLNDEQDALRDAVRGVLGRRYGAIEKRREALATERGFDNAAWQELAELGALALPFPEAIGGMDAGPLEVAVVAEEIGRVLAPEPFVEAVVLAGGLVAEAGTPEQQEDIIGALGAGELLPIFAGQEPGGRWTARPAAVTAVQSPDGWRLTGVKSPVVLGAEADLLIVSAAVGERTALFLLTPDAPGVTRTGFRTPDGGRAATIRLEAALATPLGDPDEDRLDIIERVWDRARLAYAHELLGAFETLLASTTGYLKTRTQFGATLNNFQALTHRAAELYVALEFARSTITWASILRDAEHNGDDSVDAAMATSHAWVQAARTARLLGQEAIQLHGGIGVTAEYAVGHYATRLTVIEHYAGDGAFHQRRLAAQLTDHSTIEPTE